ncbi:MAG: branched-chain amino acid ABC transporter permease [Caldisericia bacterium]|jgi:branched-chain amino acid transport system permease protein|nr:branched-chain amino acid ABC transporter permease [Caldisericia bacterium]
MEKIFNLQQLINGIQLGSIYALISLGYTMVYGIVRLINFAHGDFFMIGAFAAYFTVVLSSAKGLNIPVFLVFLISMASGAGVAALANQVAYKPLRYKPRLSALITAIGVSMFIEYIFSALPFIGPSYRAFPNNQLIKSKIFEFGTFTLSNYAIIDVLVSIGLMLFLTYLVKYTKVGKAMRAVSQDKDAAKLMGIDIEKIIMITFIVGGAFAGAAGILTGISYPRIFPYMGILPGLKAFIAAVLGGIGNIPGAMLGSYIMGISETFATSYNSLLGEGIAFAILIIVLIFRPQGLLGETIAEKV